MKGIFLIGAILTLTACVKVQEKNENAESDLKQVQSFNYESVQLEYIPQKEFNKYTVKANWQGQLHEAKLIDFDKIVISENNTEITDLEGGKSYNLVFLYKSSIDSEFNKKELTISIPQDVEFSGQVVLNRNLKIEAGRVFFRSGSRLLTRSFYTNISADRIVFENNSLIQNFDLNEKASMSNPGRSGGVMQVKANSAFGKVKIISNGEQGGNGLGGYTACVTPNAVPFPRPACNPESGASGGSGGRFIFEIKNQKELFIETEFLNTEGGQIGYLSTDIRHPSVIYESGGRNEFAGYRRPNDPNCVIPSESGQAGEKGELCLLGSDNQATCYN